jgi:biotin transport system substrate-specific component
VTALAHSISTGRTKNASLALDIGLVVTGTAFIYLLAQFKVSLLPFSPVPITLATLGVLVVGGALGWLRGGASVLLFLALALVGTPNVSATGVTGPELFYASAPTGGYLIGWFFSATLVGWLSDKGWDRSFKSSISAMLLGSIVIYLVGVPWLANAVGFDAATALEKGMYPFIVGDTIKLFVAAGLLPALWKLLGKSS